MREPATYLCITALSLAACGQDPDPASHAATPPSLAAIEDPGYSDFPQTYADVNADGFADYCRFVGNWPDVFLSCKFGAEDGYNGDEYAFNSIVGLDRGHADLPRDLIDVNGDQRADYCRFVGDAPNRFLSCNLATPEGFAEDPYTFNSPAGIDLGYGSMGRDFVDVNADGRTDFCRYVGPREEAFYCCIRAEEGGFGPDQYDCIDGVQDPEHPEPETGGALVGQTECDPLGDGDCNPCLPDVEEQFERTLTYGKVKWGLKPWRFSWGKDYQPSEITADRAYLDDEKVVRRKHIQGFVRTNVPNVPFAATHSGDRVGTVSLIRQEADGRKFLTAIHRTISAHPGSLSAIGRYVILPDGPDVRLIDVTRALESQDTRFGLYGPTPIDSDKNGGVAITKLADGGYLFAFMTGGESGNKRETHFFRLEGPLEHPSDARFLGQQLLREALAESPSSRKTWEGAKYPENMSMITECGTGNIYTVHFGAANATLDGSAVIHLAKVEQDAAGAPYLRTRHLYAVQEDDDSCWYRGGASAGTVNYSKPDMLHILCHERVTVSEDYFSFEEGVHDESVVDPPEEPVCYDNGTCCYSDGTCSVVQSEPCDENGNCRAVDPEQPV